MLDSQKFPCGQPIGTGRFHQMYSSLRTICIRQSIGRLSEAEAKRTALTTDIKFFISHNRDKLFYQMSFLWMHLLAISINTSLEYATFFSLLPCQNVGPRGQTVGPQAFILARHKNHQRENSYKCFNYRHFICVIALGNKKRSAW